jgi:hypothetical protein
MRTSLGGHHWDETGRREDILLGGGAASREFIEHFRGEGWQSGKMEGRWVRGCIPAKASPPIPPWLARAAFDQAKQVSNRGLDVES